MRSLLFIFVLVPCLSFAQTSKTGLGASTLTCVDKDGDGYGAGSGCTGPDADDYDIAVHTAAQAVTKYGNIQTFLKHRGYTWITQYWVISTTGNDTTCGTTAHTFAASPDPTAVQACATFAHISSDLSAGDVIFWRSGTYTETISASSAGTAGNWIVYLAYPGESVIWNCSSGTCFDGSVTEHSTLGYNDQPAKAYYYLDGFTITSTVSSTPVEVGTCYWNTDDCYGDGTTHTDSSIYSHDFVLRNLNVSGGSANGWNIHGNNIYNMTIEDSIVHDPCQSSSCQHDIYVGANVSLSHDFTIQRNILYDAVIHGLQINGRVTNAIVQQNISYSNGSSGYSLLEGVSHSFVRDNTAFNNGQSGLVIDDYDGDCSTSGFATSDGLGRICPYDQNYNVIEGNTFWVGTSNPNAASSNSPSYAILFNNRSANQSADIGHTTIRNNVIVGRGDGAYYPAICASDTGADPTAVCSPTGGVPTGNYFASDTFDGNILWSSDGTSTNNQFARGSTRYTCGTIASSGATVLGTCITADPLLLSASTTYTNTPASFNLHLQSSSQAVHSGSLSITWAYDLGSIFRPTPPSIGAYEYTTAGTSIPTQTWTTVQTHGAPVQDAGYSKSVYCGNGSLCGIGIYHQNWTEFDTSWRSWNYETNYWTIMDYGGSFVSDFMNDGGHSIGDIDWMPDSNKLIALCCYSGTNEPENQSNMYLLDVAGQVEESLFTRPVPFTTTVEFENASTYDPVNKLLVMIYDDSGAVEYYNPATNAWTTPTVTGTAPTNISFHGQTYDSRDGKIYVYGGGQGYVTCPATGAPPTSLLYTFQVTSPTTGTWTQLSPTGTAPAGRWRPAIAYSSQDNVFLITGGTTCTGTGGATQTLLTDSFVYDPAANSWTQVSLSTPDGLIAGDSGAYDRLVYDPDHNAFVFAIENGTNQSLDGNWTQYSVSINLFCYSACDPVGRVSNTVQPSAGSLNRYSSGNTLGSAGISWAHYNSLATSGSTLYAADIEPDGTFFDPTIGWGQEDHPYMQSTATGSTWVNLGSAYSSILADSDCNTHSVAPNAGETSTAIINGFPWIAYETWCYSDAPNWYGVVAKKWNGATWSGVRIPSRGTFASGAYPDGTNQGKIFSIGTTPYVSFREVVFNGGLRYQAHGACYIDSFDGTNWNAVGGSFVVNTYGSQPSCDATADTSGNLWAVTTEYAESSGYSIGNSVSVTAQVYVWEYTAGAWTQVGGSLNQTSTDWSSWATIIWHNGQPYVAWLERANSGQSQLYVKTYSGGAWSLVGAGAMNRNAGGWAFRPQFTDDGGTNLYLGWTEQPASGQKPQTYVSQWNGTSWTQLGGSLNMDSTNGSSQHVAIAYWNAHPVASWGEVLPGSMRQIYAKQWSGTSWVPLSTSLQLWHHGHLGHFTISGSGSRQ